MKKLCSLFAVALVFTLSGCGGNSAHVQDMDAIKTAPVVDNASETLISSFPNERPEWTAGVPEAANGYKYFSGISIYHSTEQDAREDARRNVTSAVVKEIGTAVKSRFKKHADSTGLSSTVSDATRLTADDEAQMANGMASSVKVTKWYIEKWQTETGIGYKVYALAKVPQDAAAESMKAIARKKVKEAEKLVREASNDQAKAQAEDAMAYWKKLEKEGMGFK